MRIEKIMYLVIILTLNSCKGQDKNQVKNETDSNDIIYYQNSGIKDKNAKALFNEGLEKVENLNFEIAKEKFIEANKIESNNPIILNGIAQVESKMGNIEKSIEISLKIISIDSTYAQTYANLGQNYLRIGEYESARDILIKGMKFIDNGSSETKPVLFINLSVAYLNLGDCKNALKYSTEAIEISQNQKIKDFAEKLKNESRNCK